MEDLCGPRDLTGNGYAEVEVDHLEEDVPRGDETSWTNSNRRGPSRDGGTNGTRGTLLPERNRACTRTERGGSLGI